MRPSKAGSKKAIHHPIPTDPNPGNPLVNSHVTSPTSTPIAIGTRNKASAPPHSSTTSATTSPNTAPSPPPSNYFPPTSPSSTPLPTNHSSTNQRHPIKPPSNYPITVAAPAKSGTSPPPNPNTRPLKKPRSATLSHKGSMSVAPNGPFTDLSHRPKLAHTSLEITVRALRLRPSPLPTASIASPDPPPPHPSTHAQSDACPESAP